MRVLQRGIRSPHSPSQLFALINDIERYPEFIADCAGAEILERAPERLKARLRIRKGGRDWTLVTLNDLAPPETMTMRLVEGPFEHLRGDWRFMADAAGCHVSLRLEYQSKSRLLDLAMSRFAEGLADDLIDVLQTRAARLYGQS